MSRYVFVMIDPFPSDPLEYNNIVEMWCEHKRYKLGTPHPEVDASNWDEYLDEIEKAKDPIITKSLYLYDHSGLIIRTSPFSCPWDSGQVGYAFITKEKAKKEHLSKNDCEQIIERTVEAYNKYLSGDYYAVLITDGFESCEPTIGGFVSEEEVLEFVKDEYNVDLERCKLVFMPQHVDVVSTWKMVEEKKVEAAQG